MKKCPINFSNRLLNFNYYYSKEPLVHLEPKGNTKKAKLEEGEDYWIGEDYRVVGDLIQYKGDLYKKEYPKWIPASNMKQGASRFTIKVVKVYESNIQGIDKKLVTQLGIPEKTLDYKIADDKVKEKEFSKKPEMLWRLKCYWEHLFGEGSWEKNDPIWVYEFLIKRIKPETYKNYLDVHWYEK